MIYMVMKINLSLTNTLNMLNFMDAIKKNIPVKKEMKQQMEYPMDVHPYMQHDHDEAKTILVRNCFL